MIDNMGDNLQALLVTALSTFIPSEFLLLALSKGVEIGILKSAST